MNRQFYGNQRRNRSRSQSRGPVANFGGARRARSNSVAPRPARSQFRSQSQEVRNLPQTYTSLPPRQDERDQSASRAAPQAASQTASQPPQSIFSRLMQARLSGNVPTPPSSLQKYEQITEEQPSLVEESAAPQRLQPSLPPPPTRLALPETPQAPIKETIPRHLLSNFAPSLPTEMTIPPTNNAAAAGLSQAIATKPQMDVANAVQPELEEASTTSYVAPTSPAKIEEFSSSDSITVRKASSLNNGTTVDGMVEEKRTHAVPIQEQRSAASGFQLPKPFTALKEAIFGGATPQFKISVQLAHGSPTRVVDGMSIADLYQKIAQSFDLKLEDIVFCTVNTYKNDMEKLFCGTLADNDMLFVHVRGQPIEITIDKTHGCLGLSISDNGSGRTFVKRVKPGSICARAMPALFPGQQIEKVDGQNVLAKRHFEVARMLRDIPVGTSFTLRLISPMQSGFSMLNPRGAVTKVTAVQDGMKTLRFKSNGQMVVEEKQTDPELLKKLDAVLDEYLGVQDEQLAHSLLDVVLPCETLQQLGDVIKQSELQMFSFPDELIFDVWGIVGDWKREQRQQIE